MQYRVLIADRLAEQGLEVFRREPQISIEQRDGIDVGRLVAEIPPYHGLVVRSATRVPAEVIAAAANLRVIGRAGIGVDTIDVDAATQRGVVVMNTPGGNNVTTAEHAIAMLISLARHIPQATASMKAGEWEKTRFM